LAPLALLFVPVAVAFAPLALRIVAEKALDGAAVVVHGRMSHEGQPNSPKRRRLLLTRAIKALARHSNDANTRLGWTSSRRPS